MEEKYIIRSKRSERFSFSIRQKIYDKVGKKTVRVFVPVNQVASSDFCLNRFGYPMSDIQRLMQSNNDLERSALLQKIKDGMLNLTPEQNSTYSLEEKLIMIKPRFVDTPTERSQFCDYVLNSTGQSVDELFNKTVEQEKQQPVESVKSE